MENLAAFEIILSENTGEKVRAVLSATSFLEYQKDGAKMESENHKGYVEKSSYCKFCTVVVESG